MPQMEDNKSPHLTLTDGSAPATPDSGHLAIFGSNSRLQYKNDVGGVTDIGASMTNPMTTAGDVIYSSDGSGTPARLAAGTNGHVLTLAAGIPSWAAAAGSGLSEGTSFPGGPSDGDRFRRTDIGDVGTIFVYEAGNTEWLTETLYTVKVHAYGATSSSVQRVWGFDETGMDVRLVDWTWAISVAGTNSAGAHWDAQLYTNNVAGSFGGDNLLGGAVDSFVEAPGSNNLQGGVTALGDLIDVSATPGLMHFITETGSAGALRFGALVRFRYIGT